MMKLSMQNEYLLEKFDPKTTAKMIADAGFDAIDFSLYFMKNDDDKFNQPNYREYAKEIREYTESLGIINTQTHAPFPAYRMGNDEWNAKMPDRIKRSIEISSILGAEYIIVHPIYPLPEDVDTWEFNMAFFKDIKPVAAEYGVKIAIENTFGYDPLRDIIIPTVCSFPEELHRYIDELGDENFVVCLDTGHCTVSGIEPDRAIREIGHKRLKALHVHDNNYRGDYHRLPYLGKNEWNETGIDWDKVTSALRDINYDGVFNFETGEKTLGGFDLGLYPTVLRFMHDVGRFLISKIEG